MPRASECSSPGLHCFRCNRPTSASNKMILWGQFWSWPSESRWRPCEHWYSQWGSETEFETGGDVRPMYFSEWPMSKATIFSISLVLAHQKSFLEFPRRTIICSSKSGGSLLKKVCYRWRMHRSSGHPPNFLRVCLLLTHQVRSFSNIELGANWGSGPEIEGMTSLINRN